MAESPLYLWYDRRRERFSDPKIIGGSFENTKSYYRLAVSEGYLTKPFGTSDTLRTSEPADYLAAEKGYRDYVYSTCLTYQPRTNSLPQTILICKILRVNCGLIC